jgi:hypothetical protein
MLGGIGMLALVLHTPYCAQVPVDLGPRGAEIDREIKGSVDRRRRRRIGVRMWQAVSPADRDDEPARRRAAIVAENRGVVVDRGGVGAGIEAALRRGAVDQLRVGVEQLCRVDPDS